MTRTELKGKNFRVVKTNVRGESQGFALLGFISIVPPSYADAMAILHESANMECKAAALANVTQEFSSLYLILFSIPTITVSADVVEFLE